MCIRDSYPDNDSQKELEWPGGCEDPRIAVTDDGLYVMNRCISMNEVSVFFGK